MKYFANQSRQNVKWNFKCTVTCMPKIEHHLHEFFLFNYKIRNKLYESILQHIIINTKITINDPRIVDLHQIKEIK